MERLCLLIDNENQDTSIESIKRIGKSKGLNINTKQFPVGNTEFTDVLNENGKIDIDKVIKYYKRHFKSFHFDLICFDWDLDDEEIDGIELLRHFRNNNFLKKSPTVLYSGQLS